MFSMFKTKPADELTTLYQQQQDLEVHSIEVRKELELIVEKIKYYENKKTMLIHNTVSTITDSGLLTSS